MENDYFEWLVGKVQPFTTGDYHILLETMFFKDFTWKVKRDEHRAKDGLELRNHFGAIFDRPCSVLEMLIALCERFSYDVVGINVIHPSELFWGVIVNTGLYDYGSDDPDLISSVVDAILSRDYKRNGEGGFFPLEHPKEDQRKTEIWYQMCEWWEENKFRR